MKHVLRNNLTVIAALLTFVTGIGLVLRVNAQQSPHAECAYSAIMMVDKPILMLGETGRVTNTITTTCQQRKADIVLVLDDSGSTSPSTREVLLASRDFIRKIDLANRPSYRMGLVIFEERAARKVSLTRDETELLKNLQLKGSGGTDIALGLREARSLFDGKVGADEIVVLVSDGQSGAGCQPVTREANGLGDERHSVCLGTNCDARCMRSVASDPRFFYEARSDTELDSVYDRIVANISQASVKAMNELAPRVSYKGNPRPLVRREQRRIYWDAVPAPIELSYDFEPLATGTFKVADDAWLEYTDGAMKLRRTTIVAPDIQVVGECDEATATLQGKVTINGQPVLGANVVVITKQPHATTSDSKGFYRIAGIPAGTFAFAASRKGSPLHESNVTLRNGCNVKSVDLGATLPMHTTWPLEPKNSRISSYFDHELPYAGFKVEPKRASDTIRLFSGETTDKRYSGHNGIDILGVPGDPVFAIADGEVRTVGFESGGWGNFIILRHEPTKLLTVYAHLSKARVKEGDLVDGGAIIGEVGCTGRCDKDHLHFEIITSDGTGVDNHRADPLGWDPPLDEDPWFIESETVSVPIFRGRRVGDSSSITTHSTLQHPPFDPVYREEILIVGDSSIQLAAPDGSLELAITEGSLGVELGIMKVTRLFESDRATHEAISPTLRGKSIAAVVISVKDALDDVAVAQLQKPMHLHLVAPLDTSEEINPRSVRLVFEDEIDSPLEATVSVREDRVTVVANILRSGRFRVVGDHNSASLPTSLPSAVPTPIGTPTSSSTAPVTPSRTSVASDHFELHLPILGDSSP